MNSFTEPTMTAQNRQPPGDGAEYRDQLLDGLPVTERRLEVAGVSTAVLSGGAGPPLVLLHGPGESALWWMRVIPDLVATHTVVVPDLPDHGASVVTDNPLDADSVMTWLGDLIERTCSTPPTLVGHLLGGAIAARYAAEHDEHLERLVLVDSLGLGRFVPSPRFAFGLVRFLVRPTDQAYNRFLDQCLIDRDGVIEQMGADWEPFVAYNLERARDPDVKAAMQTLMREVGIPRIPRADLARIAVPTSLLWGRQDRAIRLSVAERASARYGWGLSVIEDAGDDPKLERPQAFLEALYEVFEDRETPRTPT